MSGLTPEQMGRLWKAEAAGEPLLPVVAALIAEAVEQARAEERERVARAIEAQIIPIEDPYGLGVNAKRAQNRAHNDAIHKAARIARGEVSP